MFKKLQKTLMIRLRGGPLDGRRVPMKALPPTLVGPFWTHPLEWRYGREAVKGYQLMAYPNGAWVYVWHEEPPRQADDGAGAGPRCACGARRGERGRAAG